MKKSCYICDTPYQILNSIDHFHHSRDESEGMADIYICDWFNNAVNIAEAIKSEKIFNRVYLYKYDLSYVIKDISPNKKRRLSEYFPEKCISETVADKEACKQRYDSIYMSLYTPFSTSVVRNNVKAEIFLIDDGIATYIDRDRISIYAFPQTRDIRHILFYKVFKGGVPKYTPSAIYVYNRQMDHIDYIPDVRELYPPRDWDDDFRDSIDRVFGYKKDLRYDSIRGVYLAPTDVPENTDFSDNVAKAENIIRLFKDDLMVRVHPRSKTGAEKFEGIRTDNGKNMWELLCGDHITDDHVLIGEYSTAQFSPKLMYDREPWLIILYKALKKERGKDTLDTMSNVINELRQNYRNPGKIIVPESTDELEEILKKVILKRYNAEGKSRSDTGDS